MSCEKQFVPANNTILYCSESCRLHDQAPTYTRSQSYSALPSYSPPASPFTRNSLDDGPDIIPRFSPTQSRPRSYFNSEPYPATYQASHISSSPPKASMHSRSSTALASLRELATVLPKVPSRDPDSPPKSSSSITRTGSGVWNYIPFTSASSHSKTATPTPSATPGNSYSGSHTYTASHSFGGHAALSGYSKEKEDSHYAGAGRSHSVAYGGTIGGYGTTGGMGMDRPLPPRSGPGGYGHRPKSIDLVTPFAVGH